MISLPKLNTSYWMMMLLCTTMGELIGNLLSRNLSLGYTQGAVLDVCIFSAMIIAYIIFKVQNELFYWVLILIGNIGGTNLADWVTLDPLDNDKTWGILQPLQLGTKIGSLAVLGSLVLILLFRLLIVKRKGENNLLSVLLYWIAILLSSTFGTTSGDFITNDTPLGALWGSVALLIILAIVFGAFNARRVSAATAYWSALVLMHPVGATIGNWVSKPIGLDLGNVYTNIVMAVLFIFIFIVNARRNEAELKISSEAPNI
ncbi:MAG: hypothetical protein ACXVCP_15480 [Bdellovibrio sp.]